MDLSGFLCSKSHIFRVKDEFVFLMRISRKGGLCSCEATNLLCKSKCRESLQRIFHFLEFDLRYKFRQLIRGTLHNLTSYEASILILEEPFSVVRAEAEDSDCFEDCLPISNFYVPRFDCKVADLQYLPSSGVILLESNIALVICSSVLMDFSLTISDTLNCFNVFSCCDPSVAKLFHPQAISLLFATEQSTLIVKQYQEADPQICFNAQQCIFAYAACKFNLSPVELVQLFKLRQIVINEDGKISRSFNGLVKNFCDRRWPGRSKRNFTSGFLERPPFPDLSSTDERLVMDEQLQLLSSDRFLKEELSTDPQWECALFRMEGALSAGHLFVDTDSGELRLRTEANSWLVHLEGSCDFVNSWILFEDVSVVKEHITSKEGDSIELCYLQIPTENIFWSSAAKCPCTELCSFFVIEKYGFEKGPNFKPCFRCRALVTVSSIEDK